MHAFLIGTACDREVFGRISTQQQSVSLAPARLEVQPGESMSGTAEWQVAQLWVCRGLHASLNPGHSEMLLKFPWAAEQA